MSIEAMKMALAKFEHLWEIGIDAVYKVELLPEIQALRQAIEQAEKQEPDLSIEANRVAYEVAMHYVNKTKEMLSKPEQEPVCDKDPRGCWCIRCQLGKVCKHTAPPKPELPMSPEHLPQYIATNNIKPTTPGGGGAGGELAKPEQAEKQEPVAYIDHVNGKPKFIHGYVVQTDHDIPLYTAPPRKEWVGLTTEESSELYNKNYDLYDTDMTFMDFFMVQREVEAKLKEKNT